MKKLVDILVIRKEEDKSLEKRREEYALKRDLQARENNEAISKRLLSEGTAKSDSVKCGTEFPSEKDSGESW